MKRNRTLFAALALTLSACPLFAQDNQPAPPARQPQPPQGDAGPRRERAQGGAQRPAPGLFGAFDANHDGAIDAEEIAHAVEVLRKLDRNGDGRITLDEFSHQGDARRQQADGGNRGPQAGDGEHRGPREPVPQAGGQREQGPRVEGRGDTPRREGTRPDGDRGPRPEGEARRDGDHPRGPAQDGPRAEGSRDGQASPAGPRDQRGSGDIRHEGTQGPRPGEAPQAQHLQDHRGPGVPNGQDRLAQNQHGGGDLHREGSQPGPTPGGAPQAQFRGHRHGPGMRDGQDHFAQNPRPEVGRGGPRPPWESGALRPDLGPQGPMAMGPRMDARQGPAPLPGFGGSDRRAFRDEMRARGSQGGPGQFPQSGPSWSPQGPGQMQSPNVGMPPRGAQGPGPGGRQQHGEFRGDRGPQGPHEQRDFRPQGPRPPDVQ